MGLRRGRFAGVGTILLVFVASQANAQPSAISVSPSNAPYSSFYQTFSFAFVDGRGAGNLRFVAISIGPPTAKARQCYLFYNPPPLNRVYLMNDSATGWIGSQLLGSAGTLSNGQCSVNMATRAWATVRISCWPSPTSTESKTSVTWA